MAKDLHQRKGFSLIDPNWKLKATNRRRYSGFHSEIMLPTVPKGKQASMLGLLPMLA